MSKLFVFKDPRDGIVRMIGNDPGLILEPLGFQRSVIVLPAGVHLDTIVGQIARLPQAFATSQGREAFLEIEIGDADLAAMALLE